MVSHGYGAISMRHHGALALFVFIRDVDYGNTHGYHDLVDCGLIRDYSKCLLYPRPKVIIMQVFI